MKKVLIGAAIIATAIVAVAPAAFSTQDEDLHCPAGGTKVEANGETQTAINDLVLAAGTRVCVKAGPGNTDIVIADGEDDLQDILFNAGIKNGGGTDGKDVSYYVVYPPLDTTTTTTAPPTTTTTVPPTTTTTAPPVVTTTTAPPVTTTTVSEPPAPGPETTPAPVTSPQPVSSPATLPHTGGGDLFWIGLFVLAGGGLLWAVSRMIGPDVEEEVEI